MLYEHETPEAAGLGAQREFAMSLADTLGREGALQICRDSGWDRIFDILLSDSVTVWS